jgi:5-methyltetrahydrofolate--homocysteine methyltransferase
MIVVGEKINTSRKSIAEAVVKRDVDFIVKVAQAQVDAGATYIDVNAGTLLERETDALCWLVQTVQGAMDIPLSLDSPNPAALAEAMKLHKGEPMINSISLEKDRLDALLPIVTLQPCAVVALCMAETSMPRTTEERVEVGSELIGKLTDSGVTLERIYVDPLVQPVSVDTNMGVATLGAIDQIMGKYKGVNTICGLSNISYGLPERKLINRNFLALAIAHGLNSAILDPTDNLIMATMYTVEMLMGKDEYCGNYIDAYEKGIVSKQ